MLSMKQRYARYTVYAGGAVFFVTLVYFALLADAFYSSGDEKASPQMAQIVPSLPIDIVGKENENVDIAIDHPENGRKSTSQRIDVEGKAPEGSSVLLFVNGTLVDSVQSSDGFYRFSNVMLTRPANILQTRFQSSDDSSAASAAIMVFHQNSDSK